MLLGIRIIIINDITDIHLSQGVQIIGKIMLITIDYGDEAEIAKATICD